MTWRLRFTLLLFFLAFCLVLFRLFYWQVVKAQELSALGESQYGRSIKLFSGRGEIKTSDGYPIATEKLSYLVFVNPKEIKNKSKFIDLLSPILKIKAASLSATISLDRYWVPLKSGIDEDKKKSIEKLNLEGIGYEQEFKRFYPEASMAAHLLGFVGKNDGGDDKGYFGLEGYYDRQLQGKSRTLFQVYDALGRPILSRMEDRTKGSNGRSIAISIDRVVQFMVEKKLKESIEKFQASGGMVGIMDPKTGSIIAMAAVPSFDPTLYQNFSSEVFINPFISKAYEPGSTLKAIIMASALDAKVVKPDTKCPICGGPVQIGEYKIKTWNDQYKENITMVQIIERSDNTGMVFVARSLGLDRMFSYLERFGIGQITGIDLQGEIAPDVRSKDSWYPIDLATAGFGQGISVTPIQLLTAFASLANDGIRMEPHVVLNIETSDGDKIEIPPKELGRTVSSEVAKVMTEILVNAVNKGEAKWTKVKGYRIAGKTGTAQIPIAGHYDSNKTITSFIGFAPADDPKFAMIVIVDRPTTSIYGAETAAPIFMDIAKDLLLYYGITPTEY